MTDQDQQQQPAHEPMTAARLAAIMSLTADVVAGRIHVRFDEETAWLAILDLRREVKRLQAEELALYRALEIVLKATDDAQACVITRSAGQPISVYAVLQAIHRAQNAAFGALMKQTPDCPVAHTRALLAGSGADEGSES